MAGGAVAWFEESEVSAVLAGWATAGKAENGCCVVAALDGSGDSAVLAAWATVGCCCQTPW